MIWAIIIGVVLPYQACGEKIAATSFIAEPDSINLANNTVTLPLHRASLRNGTQLYFIVTEASTAEASRLWSCSHSAALAAVRGTTVVQNVLAVNATNAASARAVGPGSLLQLPATVNFLYGKRSVTPDPVAGFPPINFTYSARGNEGMCIHS
jgi:hypothetical protein